MVSTLPPPSELPPLLVRADADAARGTGHVMRCLALAQAWRARGGKAVFISRCENPVLRERILSAGADLVPLPGSRSASGDVATTIEQLSLRENALLVIDAYDIGPEQQARFSTKARSVLLIDDTAHLERYDCDILLNQNLGAEKLEYRAGEGTTFLLGPDYALLRREFLVWRERVRSVPAIAGKLLVTLGGSDPTNFTARVLDALGRQPSRMQLEARIVVGAANPRLAELARSAQALGPKVRIETGVTDMAELMVWADLAVTATGSTSWELLCLGVPAIGIIAADNQKLLGQELHAHGVMEVLGWHDDVSAESLGAAIAALQESHEARLSMSRQGRALVDGRGADRVADAMLEASRRTA